MQTFVIVVPNNSISDMGYANLMKSIDDYSVNVNLKIHEATLLDKVYNKLEMYKLNWKWPWNQPIEEDGFIKYPYQTHEKWKRISCALSHYELWKKCIQSNETFLILEHDSVFIRFFDEAFLKGHGEIIGINSPIGATRKSQEFDYYVQSSLSEISKIPIIDDDKIPQGLAGNSSYYITPLGAKALVDKVHEVGLWPNDALMNRQYFDRLMRVTKTYYTRISGLQSTTVN